MLPASLRASAAHVFVDDLELPELDERDTHHLGRVLRLRDGQSVTVSDGRGRWRTAVWRAGAVEPDGETCGPSPRPAVTIAAAIPKGDRLEWMVQKLTEVGVDGITLVDCHRSVVRWDAARAGAQRARLTRIVRDAAMQSRRTWLPELAGPVPLVSVLDGDGAVVVADPAGAVFDVAAPVTVVVGPEGGFTPDEVAGAQLVALGDHVLRVETAAVVAVVLATQFR
ncbi:MAG: RsmE family RNA methyltransferase [Ilumatobacteraceae bacterium]